DSARPKSTLGGFDVVKAIRALAGKLGVIKSLRLYVDIVGGGPNRRFPAALASELQCSGVTIVDTVSGGRHGGPSKMLMTDLFLQAMDNTEDDDEHQTALVVTADPDVGYALSLLRGRGHSVVLLCPSGTNSNLLKLDPASSLEGDMLESLTAHVDSEEVVHLPLSPSPPSAFPFEIDPKMSLTELPIHSSGNESSNSLPDDSPSALATPAPTLLAFDTDATLPSKPSTDGQASSPKLTWAMIARRASDLEEEQEIPIATSDGIPGIPEAPAPESTSPSPSVPSAPSSGFSFLVPSIPLCLASLPPLRSLRPCAYGSVPYEYVALVDFFRDRKAFGGTPKIDRADLQRELLKRQPDVFIQAKTAHFKKPIKLYVRKAAELQIVNIDVYDRISLHPNYIMQGLLIASQLS
ncbi:hypothetical protein BKA70DRAFT_1089129, partial [Coprinopsis sp. MPI-PUGE-AT-0042]